MNKLNGCRRNYSRGETIKGRKVFVEIRYSKFCYELDEKNYCEILSALHYKPLYNINCNEKWGEKYASSSL